MVLGFKIPDPPAQGVEPALVCLAEDVPLVRSKVRVQVTVRVRVGIRVLLLRSQHSSIGFVLREGLRLRLRPVEAGATKVVVSPSPGCLAL